MTLTSRDKRLLIVWASIMATGIGYEFWPDSSPAPVAATAQESVTQSEQRLARMRDLAATVPGKEAVAKQVQDELTQREQGLLAADTAPQAQAQMIQLVRKRASAETPPVEIKSTEIGPVAPLGDSYGSANVSFQFDCGIEQLVNLLAGLGSQREILAPSDLRIIST